MYPTVAIVGRPNVGKSTLFNKISGKRIAIVAEQPGVTRDRIYCECDWSGRYFRLVDTSGIEYDGSDETLQKALFQTEVAIEIADVILFVVDIKEGISPCNERVAHRLKKSNKKLILVCNKVDNEKLNMEVYELYNLGLGEPIGISAANGIGIGDLLDKLLLCLPSQVEPNVSPDTIKIAVIGKPNVGKSSFVNKVLGDSRCIVSDIPGTTRDAIDQSFKKEGQQYIIIDTAGIRKRHKVNENIERYSVARSLNAVDRADVSLIMLDARDGVTEQDTKIAGYVHNTGKPSVILVNKWDLITKETNTFSAFQKSVKRDLSYMGYALITCVSALNGQRINEVFGLIQTAFEQNRKRVETGVLNQIIADAIYMMQPPSDKGKRLKIYFITQVGILPPTFVIFVNNKDLAHFSYIRYLENKIRDAIGYVGTPLKFIVKERRNCQF